MKVNKFILVFGLLISGLMDIALEDSGVLSNLSIILMIFYAFSSLENENENTQ